MCMHVSNPKEMQTSIYVPHSSSIRCFQLYCIVFIHLYSASCSAHQSEVLPVRETHREESSLQRNKALGSPFNKVDRVKKKAVHKGHREKRGRGSVKCGHLRTGGRRKDPCGRLQAGTF